MVLNTMRSQMAAPGQASSAALQTQHPSWSGKLLARAAQAAAAAAGRGGRSPGQADEDGAAQQGLEGSRERRHASWHVSWARNRPAAGAAARGARAGGTAGELSTAPSAPARRHIVTARQFTRAAPLASELPVFQELRHRCCS